MSSSIEVYNFFVEYMRRFPQPVSAWFAGIASDADAKLIKDHGVTKDAPWAYDTCDSPATARAVKDALIKFGCKGSGDMGNKSTKSCYVYLITSTTRQ